MGARFRGYLGEVGDGQDLVAIAECSQFRADRHGRLATDTGVDLVEDVGRTGLYTLLGEPYGQHDPGEFTARGVAPHGQLGLARVRLDHELHPLGARGSRLRGYELRAEGGLLEVEVPEIILHLLRQPLGSVLPSRTQRRRDLLEASLAFCEPLLQIAVSSSRVSRRERRSRDFCRYPPTS